MSHAKSLAGARRERFHLIAPAFGLRMPRGFPTSEWIIVSRFSKTAVPPHPILAAEEERE